MATCREGSPMSKPFPSHCRSAAWLLAMILLVAALPLSAATSPAAVSDPALEQVRQLLAITEEGTDLARAKLAIDKLIDPTIDIDGTLRQLDEMAAQARALVPANASKHDTVVALQTY